VTLRILLTGAHGQLGSELLPLLQPLGGVVAAGRAECDFSAPDSIRGLVEDARPQLIINTAAYTAVNDAESQRELAFAINATAPGVLAEEARRHSAMLIHYSTDYVFDGAKAGPYTESDEPSPLNVYGASKLAGERSVAAVGGRWIILRTSWVYGPGGNNFLRTIHRLARERDVDRAPQVFGDEPRLRHRPGAFRDRTHERDLVHLLEGALPLEPERRAAADQEQRAPRRVGVGHPGDRVGDAGTGHDDGDAKAAREPRPGIRRVGRRLLVPHVDDLDAVSEAAIVDRQDVAAAEREDDGHALAGEDARDQLAPGRVRHATRQAGPPSRACAA